MNCVGGREYEKKCFLQAFFGERELYYAINKKVCKNLKKALLG